jgi:hypothetical protein
MEEELNDLRDEIDYLTKRIETLESAENRRKAAFYIKLLVKVVLIVLFAYGLWRGYDYVVHEIPNIMEEKIKELNPLKKN